MVNIISSEIIIFVFLSFFIFSYLLKYLSILFNKFYRNNNLLKYELYESGSPLHFKTSRNLDLQSYILALFFLIFELELFITYPCIIYTSQISFDITLFNYELYYNNKLNLCNNFEFSLLYELIGKNIKFGVFPVFYVFFFNLICALALEWVYGGLEFLSKKIGRF